MGNILTSTQHDPYLNLAAEEYLLERATSPTLYLWINEPSVIVGKHQNIFKEVDLNFIAAKGIHAVRRTTGGGAVYHDLGNLNYSFVIPNSLYDLNKQNGILIDSLKKLGIAAYFSGRNDILADGKKIGGEAYKKTAKNGLHHGTILVDLDMAAAQSALTPSAVKLAAKGVDSVRARIANITDFVPEVNVRNVADTLAEHFTAEYGGAVIPFRSQDYRERAAKFASDDWIFGNDPPCSLELPLRINGENIELQLQIHGGIVSSVNFYGDFIDASLPDKLRPVIVGKKASELTDLSVQNLFVEF